MKETYLLFKVKLDPPELPPYAIADIQNFLRKSVRIYVFFKRASDLYSFITGEQKIAWNKEGYLYVGVHRLHHLKNTQKLNKSTGNTLAGYER